MAGALPAESNIQMTGPGVVGRSASGAGPSRLFDPSDLRTFGVVYSTSDVDALLSGKAASSHTHAQSEVTGLVSALGLKADLVGGLVPAGQLPSYVDDVIEAANFAALPGTGESGRLYVTLDDSRVYRWSGSAYVELTDSTAVWGSVSGTLSNQTDLHSALTARALTATLVSAGTGLTGGGSLASDRTLSVSFGTSGTTACVGNDSRLSDSRTPTTHATSHKSGGTDAVKLDELAAPTDVTTLNASTTAHGLLPKLSNVATEYLSGTGVFSTPAGGTPGGSTKQIQFNNAGAFGGAAGFEFQAGASPNVLIVAQAASYVPLVVRGAASQTRNLTEWQNGSSQILGRAYYTGTNGLRIYISGRANGSADRGFTFMGDEGSGVGTFTTDLSTGFSFDGVTVGPGRHYSGSGMTLDRNLPTTFLMSHGAYFSDVAARAVTFAAADAYTSAVTNTVGGAFTINAGAGGPLNSGGGAVTISGGKGRGTGTPGVVKLQTTVTVGSGTTLQTLRDVCEFDGNTTTGESALRLLDLTSGTLKRISFGADDSGGTGFKVLRVAN